MEIFVLEENKPFFWGEGGAVVCNSLIQDLSLQSRDLPGL